MALFRRDRTFVIAEAGINHNGSVDMALKLVDAAADAGCDAVKFQKKTPELSLPKTLWKQERDTPWGERMSYLEYRKRMELGFLDYSAIDDHCRKRGILWSASPWDVPSVRFLDEFDLPFIKVASASVTDTVLLNHIGALGKPVVMSTGMSTLSQVEGAVKALGHRPDIGNASAYCRVPELALLVCTSTYPALPKDLNLARIYTLQDHFTNATIGYSGHEPGLWTTLCAVAMGARVVERHLTLDRTLPGTDQAASVEPAGMKLLVREIRQFETALGDPAIRVLDCEEGSIKRLRG